MTQGFMVGEYVKRMSLDITSKMCDGTKDSEQLSVESRVFLFGVGKFLGKESDRSPISSTLLFQAGSDRDLRGIDCDPRLGP